MERLACPTVRSMPRCGVVVVKGVWRAADLLPSALTEVDIVSNAQDLFAWVAGGLGA